MVKDSRDACIIWRLNLEYMVTNSIQKHRRALIIQFENEHTAKEWARSIESATSTMSGNTDLAIRKNTENSMRRSQHALGGRGYPCSRLSTSLARVCTNFGNVRGWLFVRPHGEVGLKSFHLRYLVIKENEVLVFKNESVNEAAEVRQYNIRFAIM